MPARNQNLSQAFRHANEDLGLSLAVFSEAGSVQPDYMRAVGSEASCNMPLARSNVRNHPSALIVQSINCKLLYAPECYCDSMAEWSKALVSRPNNSNCDITNALPVARFPRLINNGTVLERTWRSYDSRTSTSTTTGLS
jgi:hypothetical protein